MRGQPSSRCAPAMRLLTTICVALLLCSFAAAIDGDWGTVSPSTDLPSTFSVGQTIKAGFYVTCPGSTAYCATDANKACIKGIDQVILVDLTVNIPVTCVNPTTNDNSINRLSISQSDIKLSLPEKRNSPFPSNKQNDAATYFFEYSVPAGGCSSGQYKLDTSRAMTYSLSFDSNNNANQGLQFAVHAGVSNAAFSPLTNPLVAASYFAPNIAGGADTEEAKFCQYNLDLVPGDTFNIRNYLRYTNDPSRPIDYSTIKFTYTLAGANDPNPIGDWHLGDFNAGSDVTVSAQDAALAGNHGTGRFRIYSYKVGNPNFYDHMTIRVCTDPACPSDIKNPVTGTNCAGPTSTPSVTTTSPSEPSGNTCPAAQDHVSDTDCGHECVCSAWELLDAVPASASTTTFKWQICNTCKYDVSWFAICTDGLTVPPALNAAIQSGTLTTNRCTYKVEAVDGKNAFPPCKGYKFSPQNSCFGGVGAASGAGNSNDQVKFCQYNLDLRPGDTFNIRDYLRYDKDPTRAIDWTNVKFTYTLVGANDPTIPADWHLSDFNAGTAVTVTAADSTLVANHGTGRFRIYAYRVGQAKFDDHMTIRVDPNGPSDVQNPVTGSQCGAGSPAEQKSCDFVDLTVVTPPNDFAWQFFQHAGQGKWIDQNNVDLTKCCKADTCQNIVDTPTPTPTTPAGSTTPGASTTPGGSTTPGQSTTPSESTTAPPPKKRPTCPKPGFAPPGCNTCLDLSDIGLVGWCIPDGGTPPKYIWDTRDAGVTPAGGVLPGQKDASGYTLSCDCKQIEQQCATACSGNTCICDLATGTCTQNALCSVATPPQTTPGQVCVPCASDNGAVCGGRGVCNCDGSCTCATINNVTYTGAACDEVVRTKSCADLQDCRSCTSDEFLSCSWCSFAGGARCQADTCSNGGIVSASLCDATAVSFAPEPCPNNCSGNGICVNTSTAQICRCANGFHGLDCGSTGGLSAAAKAAAIGAGVIAAIVICGVIVLVVISFGAKKAVDFVAMRDMNMAATSENPMYDSQVKSFDNRLPKD